MKTKLLLAIFWLLCASALHAQWRQKNNPSMNVKALLANGGNLYAVSRHGVYLSKDNGESWERFKNLEFSFDSFKSDEAWNTSLSISSSGELCVAIAMNFYVSNGLPNDINCYWNYGSIDWDGNIISAAALNPNQTYVTSSKGFFRYGSNGGDPADWFLETEVITGLPEIAKPLTITAHNGNLYLTTSQGIYLSTNGGDTWSNLFQGQVGENENFSHFVVSESTLCAVSTDRIYWNKPNDNTLWSNALLPADLLVTTVALSNEGITYTAGVSTSTNLPIQGIYHSADFGQAWQYQPNEMHYPTTTLAINGNTLHSGGLGGIYRSSDNGVSWTESKRGINTNILAIASTGNELYLGTERGLYISTDNGETSRRRNTSISPSFAVLDGDVYASDQDGSTYVYLGTGGHINFGSVLNHEDNRNFPLEAIGSDVYSIGIYGKPHETKLISTDRTQWTSLPEACRQAVFFAEVAGIRYGVESTGQVTVSADNGSTWTRLDNPGFPFDAGIDPETQMEKEQPFATSLFAVGSNLFANTHSREVFRLAEDGISWAAVDWELPEIPLESPYVHRFFASGDILYAFLFKNATGDDSPHVPARVFRSGNLGETWNEVTGDFPDNIKINTLNVIGSEVFAGTEAGLWALPLDLTGDSPKNNQTISFVEIPVKTFGDAPFALDATASSELPIVFTSDNTDVATISDNIVTIVGGGSALITASQAGDDLFYAANHVYQRLTVNKASQTITFSALATKRFGDASFTLTGTASSGLPITYFSSNANVATISGNTVTIKGVGTATITAYQSGNASFNAAVNVRQTLRIAKGSQTITFAALAVKRFGDASFTLNGAASSGLGVVYASSNPTVATIFLNSVTIVGVGSTTITASQPGNANFNAAANVRRTLTVNKFVQTINIAPLASKRFGDAPFTINKNSTAGLPVSFSSNNVNVATISGNTFTIVGAGTATITASQAGNANVTAAANVTQRLTVEKASQTITFLPLVAKIVGDAPFALTSTASSKSGIPVTYASSNTRVAAISGNTVTILGAGTTTITAFQPGNANFYGAIVTQTLTVNPSSTSTAKVNSEPSTDQTSIITGDIESVEPGIFVSPNPVQGLLELHGIVGEIQANQLFDMTGRAGSPIAFEKHSNLYSASVEHLSQGVYLLKLLQDNKVVQIKFIKK